MPNVVWCAAQLYAKFEGVVAGNELGRCRSKPEWRSVCPTIEAQVECLMDLAIDPNMLARQWMGLATFV